MTLACLLASPARAAHWAVTYACSGTNSTPPSQPISWAATQNTDPAFEGCGYGPYTSAVSSGSLTATLTWTSDGEPNLPPAPSQVNILQTLTCSATGSSPGCTATDSWGDTFPGSGTVNCTGQFAHLVQMPNPNLSTTLTLPSVSATVSAYNATGAGGNCYASIKLTTGVTTLAITLTGPVQDSGGAYHILIGQGCTANLGGSGNTVSNLSWTVSGNTVQKNSWSPSADSTSATFSGLVNPYTFTQATASSTPPHWYWDDNQGSKTITCAATVTPSSGPAFSVTATVQVELDEPKFTSNEPIGAVQVNATDPHSSGPTLYAGPGKAAVGIILAGTVTTPPTAPFSGGGSWFHTQLITLNRTAIPKGGTVPVSLPGDGVPGALDFIPPTPKVVYDSVFNADGKSGNVYPNTDTDEPGQPLDDTYQEYMVGTKSDPKNTTEAFTDYMMYTPPGSDSIRVPLAFFTWSWSADVTYIPTPKTWSKYTGPVTGTITASGAAARTLTYPTWTKAVNIANFP